ncbi:MAG: alpha/beta hydrolase [Bacteroidales bacterium]|nr:alpha/beta hydrolase [Bacteroidales bacterium]
MADLGTICQALLDAGYAVVTPNHRSSSDAKFPAQINDIKAVIRYIRAHAAEYKFDASFIAASGFSSGGHLASLAGTAGNAPELEGEVGGNLEFSSAVNAVCDWSGPVDMFHMDCAGDRGEGSAGPEEAVMGFPIKGNEARFAALNATSYIDSMDPPVIIFHGNADTVVPGCQGPWFYERLTEGGVKADLNVVEGGGHGFNMYTEETLGKMVSFLDGIRAGF